jgi:hypothetical protein
LNIGKNFMIHITYLNMENLILYGSKIKIIVYH